MAIAFILVVVFVREQFVNANLHTRPVRTAFVYHGASRIILWQISIVQYFVTYTNEGVNPEQELIFIENINS